eukprot:1157408-Pelagomonas_calceolata.AAC.12
MQGHPSKPVGSKGAPSWRYKVTPANQQEQNSTPACKITTSALHPTHLEGCTVAHTQSAAVRGYTLASAFLEGLGMLVGLLTQHRLPAAGFISGKGLCKCIPFKPSIAHVA